MPDYREGLFVHFGPRQATPGKDGGLWRAVRAIRGQPCDLATIAPVHGPTRRVHLVVRWAADDGGWRGAFLCPACQALASDGADTPIRLSRLTDPAATGEWATDEALAIIGIRAGGFRPVIIWPGATAEDLWDNPAEVTMH